MLSKISDALNTFKNQYVDSGSWVLFSLLLFNVCLAAALNLTNLLDMHFTGNTFFPAEWGWANPLMLALFCVTLRFSKDLHPRVAFFTYYLPLYFFIAELIVWVTMGIQYTPFHPIDQTLLHWDQALHFSTPALLSFTQAHLFFHKLMIFTYNALEPELYALPLLMAALYCKRSTQTFLIAVLISYPIGALIYYFFPTTAPASIIHNPHFMAAQHDTYLKFYEVHHRMQITTGTDGGLIAFPSFHVIWGILLAYLTIERKWIFYPVACFNALLILATMMLGWHYLVDVLAGATIAAGSLAAAVAIYRRYFTIRKCGFLGDCKLPASPAPPEIGGGSSSLSSSLKTIPRPFSKA